ncbi:hypothetical protein [Fibrobacter sp.]|uniref:hypothetical protein n=1 Tax=Fibrobacter sp. TaxID=35828 RepID=UPI003865CD04
MAKKDNIAVRYEAFQKRPGSMNNALRNFSRITEETYASFKSVVADHADIGKAAIVIMASNFASHLVKLATDESKDKARRIYEVSGAIAPMYEMMYDRLTKETIEDMLKQVGTEESPNA